MIRFHLRNGERRHDPEDPQDEQLHSEQPPTTRAPSGSTPPGGWSSAPTG